MIEALNDITTLWLLLLLVLATALGYLVGWLGRTQHDAGIRNELEAMLEEIDKQRRRRGIHLAPPLDYEDR
jgi:hypothetical protein